MIDSLGKPQSLLLVGGTSEIGLAIARELSGRLQRLVLAGRDRSALSEAGRGFAAVPEVQVVDLDLLQPDTFAPAIESTFTADIDVAVLATGVLPGPGDDPSSTAQVNYVSPMALGERIAAKMRAQGHGVVVVLSSVAAERPRADNYLYGSTKAGLDAWANGLADSLVGTGVRILVVRPGMVRTRMSANSPEAPMTCEKEDVATAVAKHLVSGPTTIWVPWQLQFLMSGLRHLPRPVFRKVAATRSQ